MTGWNILILNFFLLKSSSLLFLQVDSFLINLNITKSILFHVSKIEIPVYKQGTILAASTVAHYGLMIFGLTARDHI